MRRHLTLLVFLLAFLALWTLVPRGVLAQEITSTPEEFTLTPAETLLPETATPLPVGISSPANGAVISGIVEIKGTALSAWDLAFSYVDDPTNTWFSINQSIDPVSEGILATWDTTGITDGSYILRLHVSEADVSQDSKVTVQVRNNSSTETATPELSTSTSTPVLVATSVPITETPAFSLTLAPSPTLLPPLPPNPAILSPQEIAFSFGKGVLGVSAVFAFIGLLIFIASKFRS